MNHFNSVMAAYLVIWGVLFIYSFTISRRMARLRDEIERLRATIGRGSGLSATNPPVSANRA